MDFPAEGKEEDLEVKRGAEALSASGPVIFCADEEGGWDVGKTLNWTLSDGRTGSVEGPQASHPSVG